MFRQINFIIIGVILLVIALLSGYIIEDNSSGYVQVKQAATTGDLSVRVDPGPYLQLFSTITTYKISDAYNYKEEVRFGDASTATIAGQIKYSISLKPEDVLRIHRDFRSDNAVQNQLIRQTLASALRQSATYFRAEDVYSTRRADFIKLVNDQIEEGIFATTYSEKLVKGEEGKIQQVKEVRKALDEKGNSIVSEESGFKIYNVKLIQNPINDIDFDDATDTLINTRKEFEQTTVTAKAEAETAKQRALTAIEEGRRKVAVAEAEALVEAKKAIVNAEKETRLAEQAALQANEAKKAIIAKGEADARATQLKVAAGLSPLEKAQIDKETAIGVAEQLAKVKLPTVMVTGGGQSGSSPLNPFDAVGLESFIKMSKGLAEAQ